MNTDMFCLPSFTILYFPPFMTYFWIYNKTNKTGATTGAGTAFPSRAPEFTHVFSGVLVASS
jgi:hypothetical protein